MKANEQWTKESLPNHLTTKEREPKMKRTLTVKKPMEKTPEQSNNINGEQLDRVEMKRQISLLLEASDTLKTTLDNIKERMDKQAELTGKNALEISVIKKRSDFSDSNIASLVGEVYLNKNALESARKTIDMLLVICGLLTLNFGILVYGMWRAAH